MSEDSKKSGESPGGNGNNNGNAQKGNKTNEGFNKGQRPDVGGGKKDSGEFGRGHTKPKRPRKNSD